MYKGLKINSRRGMDKRHRCFTSQNHCAYSYVEMGTEEGKASYDSAYKQLFVVPNHYEK